MNGQHIGRTLRLLVAAGVVACAGCEMGGSKAPVGSAGIADSAASAASAPPPARVGSSPGAR